jgi:hypothetical protein
VLELAAMAAINARGLTLAVGHERRFEPPIIRAMEMIDSGELGSSLVNGDTLAILATYNSGGHALISAILATPCMGRLAVYCSQGWVKVRDKSHPEDSTGWVLTSCKRGWDDAPMKVEVWGKDMSIIDNALRALCLPSPLFAACIPIYHAAMAQCHALHDTAAVYAVLEKFTDES